MQFQCLLCCHGRMSSCKLVKESAMQSYTFYTDTADRHCRLHKINTYLFCQQCLSQKIKSKHCNKVVSSIKQTFKLQRILGGKAKSKNQTTNSQLAQAITHSCFRIRSGSQISLHSSFSLLYCSVSERNSSLVYLNTQTWRQAEYLKHKCPCLEKQSSSHKKK